MVEFTEKEKELTRYCDDFCPIYQAITDYNKSHRPTISCASEMCEKITEAYVLHLRKQQLRRNEE